MISACRPLWQVLSVAQPGRDTTLSCDECFAILELLAEAAAAGAHAQTLREAVQRHLTHCPDCREHHLRRLYELEAMWTDTPTTSDLNGSSSINP